MLYLHKQYYNIKSLRERKDNAKERLNYDSTIRTNLHSLSISYFPISLIF